MKLGIREQILSLLAVPLVVLLACVGVMLQLQADTRNWQLSTSHSTLNLEYLASLGGAIEGARAAAGSYVLTGDHRYTREGAVWSAGVQPTLRSLRLEVEGADDPNDSARVRHLDTVSTRAIASLHDEMNAAVSGHRTDALFLARLKRAETDVSAVKAAIAEWIHDESRQRVEARARLSRTLALSTMLLWVFGLTGLVVSLALARAVARALVTRLLSLSRNAQLFASGQPMEQPVGGNDEVTELDHVLRTVSSRLQERELALKEALQRANDLAQVKSEFVATLSHEIRSPLNGVIGMSELLLESELTGEQREYAEGARVSGQALLGVINDMLDFSKIEAGRLELDASDFEILPMVESVATLLNAQAQAKRIALASYVDGKLPRTVRGDAHRLRQVLLNLAGNAVKFTASGSVVINAALDADLGTDVRIKFEVTDTGIGIEPAIATALFEPFRQADASTTRQYGGTGLGLAISKSLVQMMRGKIGVESTPGSGSTFWFSVTLPKSTNESIARDAQQVAGARAIIVDTDPLAAEFLLRYVRGFGMRTFTALDVESALDRLDAAAKAAEPFDVVLVDQRVLGSDGAAFAERVRRNGLIAKTPLILMARHQDTNDVDAVIKEGFHAHVPKPVRQSELLNAIAGALNARIAAVSSPDMPTASPTVTRSEKILVVEDHLINQRLAVMQLERLGFTPKAVANGLEAVHRTADDDFDLVLMDCDMPVMDGFAATAEIRKRELRTRRHVTIVAMTANATLEDRDECIASGMDDFLAKPVRVGNLKDLLAKWLPSSSQESAG